MTNEDAISNFLGIEEIRRLPTRNRDALLPGAITFKADAIPSSSPVVPPWGECNKKPVGKTKIFRRKVNALAPPRVLRKTKLLPPPAPTEADSSSSDIEESIVAEDKTSPPKPLPRTNFLKRQQQQQQIESAKNSTDYQKLEAIYRFRRKSV